MNRMIFLVPVLLSTLVPTIVLSKECTRTNSSTDTKLELVPKLVPMVPKVPSRPLEKKELIKGKRYLSLNCDVPKDIRDQIRNRYKMTPVWWGLNDHDHTYLVHRNPKTNNWVMFAAFKSGAICVVGTGPTGALVDVKSGEIH